MSLHVTSEISWKGFLATWLVLSILTMVSAVPTVKLAHIICNMLEFSSTFIKLCYACEELEVEFWGVFYRGEEYT